MLDFRCFSPRLRFHGRFRCNWLIWCRKVPSKMKIELFFIGCNHRLRKFQHLYIASQPVCLVYLQHQSLGCTKNHHPCNHKKYPPHASGAGTFSDAPKGFHGLSAPYAFIVTVHLLRKCFYPPAALASFSKSERLSENSTKQIQKATMRCTSTITPASTS